MQKIYMDSAIRMTLIDDVTRTWVVLIMFSSGDANYHNQRKLYSKLLVCIHLQKNFLPLINFINILEYLLIYYSKIEFKSFINNALQHNLYYYAIRITCPYWLEIIRD